MGRKELEIDQKYINKTKTKYVNKTKLIFTMSNYSLRDQPNEVKKGSSFESVAHRR